MSGKWEEKAALVGPCVGGVADTTGKRGLYYRANAAASSTAVAIKPSMWGKWLNAFASVSEFQYAFGIGAAPTIVYDQDVTAGTGHVNAGATVPGTMIVALGVIPSGATHISLYSKVASGKIELYISELPAS